MSDQQVSTLKIIDDTHYNAPRQSSTCDHFHVFVACLLQESRCVTVLEMGSEICARKTEVRETQDELTACPAVEPSGETNPKHETPMKTDTKFWVAVAMTVRCA
jgi:hypothetical protein